MTTPYTQAEMKSDSINLKRPSTFSNSDLCEISPDAAERVIE
jgi:hypothetical protein